ncbi:hypothetical protein ACFL3J_03370 [Candidatus Omnitrophota bacterium]
MAPKKLTVKQEDKSAARDYLKKATDNYEQMLSALRSNNYNSVGTLAIQCVISSADAVCVHEKGIRSISQDHFDVCDLVKSIPLPEARDKGNLLRKIIAKKNLIQYERRNLYLAEADEIAKLAGRFHQWVVGIF